jgi:hypothetical protein
MAALHSKWVGNLLRFYQGSTTIVDIDGANSLVDLKSMKLNGTAITATGAQLNALASSSAGIAALLSGGLGASVSYLKTKADTTTLLTADAAKDRAILVLVTVDEVMAAGNGNAPTFSIGETTTGVAAFAATSAFAGKAAGTVLAFSGKNLATKHVTVTGTAATGTATGGITVTVISVPMT